MSKLVLRFLNDDSATTAIEYALIAAGVSIVIIGAVNTIGTQLNTVLYDKIATALK
jgi:pilus assembly protein Flp/PilA